MGRAHKYFLRLFIFFMLLFFVERIIFLLFLFPEIKTIPFREILMVFRHALSMDAASACALMLIPFLLMAVIIFSESKRFQQILKFYIVFIILFTSVINACDAALFKSWGTRINSQAISYLAFPGEAISNAYNLYFLFILLVFLLMSYLFILIYRRFFHEGFINYKHVAFKIIFLLLTPFILIIGIRGGFQTFPLDRSWVYFSRHSVLNQAAINSSWNFFHALTDPVEIRKNPYSFFQEDLAWEYFNRINHTEKDTTTFINKTNRPNIVLIMLESFSAEVMEPLGGKKEITPNLNALTKEGLLFTNFYTPGFRTEQGLAALVSGFPSQPTTSIIRQFGKFDKLPSLARTLDSAGYNSSYYYGGNLHFAFTGSYLQACGFDKIIGENDFVIKRRTDWGAYDEELFDFFKADIQSAAQPFFSIIMTSTNHEPFNADVKKITPSIPGDWCGDYINTVHYTDRCIGEFFSEIKKQKWYDSSLVFVVADHAHICPEKFEYNSAPRHRIPFLVLGGALKDEFRGKVIGKIASQIDFPSSVLSLLKLESGNYKWSKNIFNPYSPSFAFYSFDEGFGWVDENQKIVYDQKLKRILFFEKEMPSRYNDSILNAGKAYLQLLLEDYLNLSQGK